MSIPLPIATPQPTLTRHITDTLATPVTKQTSNTIFVILKSFTITSLVQTIQYIRKNSWCGLSICIILLWCLSLALIITDIICIELCITLERRYSIANIRTGIVVFANLIVLILFTLLTYNPS